ncbi:ArsR/SmtB family transcription factor [Lutibaculum baratangense]|uniref:Transcriptional regulator SoxR n=1 Tax=Lutibaculum baratangense AMV1 TaxID=631454 RepID=V4RPR7_9HYPH|nr:metalloregulator ArsR/SmtB family transcription factor [Lutibaculum baratangense]ESR27274.1 transcriptional regulator SoxR [Lutibaculum baratangense AMV1]
MEPRSNTVTEKIEGLRPPQTAAEFDALVDKARQASDLLKALSHETRLLILCLLSDGEKSVSELERILTMPQAAVSQQLARLRFDGLVETRREGRMIYYRIAGDEVARIIAALYDLFCRPVVEQDT